MWKYILNYIQYINTVFAFEHQNHLYMQYMNQPCNTQKDRSEIGQSLDCLSQVFWEWV